MMVDGTTPAMHKITMGYNLARLQEASGGWLVGWLGCGGCFVGWLVGLGGGVICEGGQRGGFCVGGESGEALGLSFGGVCFVW